jgi:hypothetical protein
LNHFEAQVYQKDKILVFKIKTKLLAQCRVWKHKYQTQELKRRLVEAEYGDMWADMEIDSSRLIQKFASTMMLNALFFVLIGIKLPWLYFGKFSLSLYDAVSLFPFVFSGGVLYFVFGSGFLFYFIIRSLISKKFQWSISLILSGSFFLIFIFFYFFLKSAISEELNVTTVTGPGVWVSLFAALLITVGGLVIYLTRKKDNHIKNIGMYYQEKPWRQKRRPGKR